MNDRITLTQIKQGLEDHLGKKVRLRANKSRKRVVEKEGVIEGIYPSIFVIKVEEKNRNPRNISFCYSDLLTHAVELTLCENDKEIVCG